MGGPKPTVKSFGIDKRLVYGAWVKVRANQGAPGVDAVRITEFAARERDNLYLLWNRMSSGSYFPGPVRAVEIPKDHGSGVRVLGVPNVADRVAQTAAAMLLEEKLEPIFHPDSYGYRDERWILLYIARWLMAPMQMPDGTLIARERGTPQGSPISSLLANLFMHYAFSGSDRRSDTLLEF